MLGRSLLSLRNLVENTLSDVRMGANIQQTQQVPVATFLSEIAVAGHLHAENRTLGFIIDPIDPALAVNGDPQLLGSAVMNLLNNAFKYTQAGGRVVLRALRSDRHVQIEVEDECGGIPGRADDSFKAFSDRRMNDRTGLGLGLLNRSKGSQTARRRHPRSQPARQGLRVCHRAAPGRTGSARAAIKTPSPRFHCMFIIELVYKADLSAIDAHMAAHVKFLNKYYTAGNFLISGRKIPRDGGIILAVAKSRSEIETDRS